MGLSPEGNHHRRRSSVLTGAGGPSQSRLLPTEPHEDRGGRSSPRDGDGPRGEEQKPLTAEDTDSSDLSSIAETDDEAENGPSDDDLNDDEETGLTAKQRNERRRRRKKQRRRLDARIAGSKKNPRRLADKNVIMRLLINAALIGLWYLFSLSISIYNKWMFSDDAVVFPFPLFTTSLHMVVQFILSALLLYFIPSLRPRHPTTPMGAASIFGTGTADTNPVMTKFFYATRLVPCGGATSLDVGLGNMSLKFISLTFLTMCKSSALAFVLLFAFVFRLEAPSIKLIIIIATMTIGVIMMVAGETAFNALGFALVIASAFFSGFRWALTQILLLRHPATSNPFSTLFFLTPVMFLSLIAIALAVEGPAEIAQGLGALAEARGPITGILLLIFPGILAFCMISSEFALLKRSSVVTLSICGIFKEVVTISAAGVVFHDKLTPVNVSGLIITIGSIAAYNYMKISKMRRDARRELERKQSNAVGYSIPPVEPEDARTTSGDGLGLGIGNSNGGRGTYQSIPDEAFTEFSHSVTGEAEDNINVTPASDIRRGRHSFRVLASGTNTAPGGLSGSSTQTPDAAALGGRSQSLSLSPSRDRDGHDRQEQ
ncbi:hypothetical protein VTN77DRAFT_3663 [Rasamsonia byssochlamydoides]|uniref:uncharacterized protein n=1 Tax=Rasamsonia byssochlamydoides TaxID=89139 RepID=UPI00374307C4